MPIFLTFLTFEVCASIGICSFFIRVSSLQEKVLNSNACFQSLIWKLNKHLRVCGFVFSILVVIYESIERKTLRVVMVRL